MKQSTFKKLLLLISFLFFTIASATVSYCLENGDSYYKTLATKGPKECSECKGTVFEYITSDWEEFGYVIYICKNCGRYYVEYE